MPRPRGGAPAGRLLAAAAAGAAAAGAGDYAHGGKHPAVHQHTIGTGQRDYPVPGEQAYRTARGWYNVNGITYSPSYIGYVLGNYAAESTGLGESSETFYGTGIPRDKKCVRFEPNDPVPLPVPDATRAWVWGQGIVGVSMDTFEPVMLEVDLYKDLLYRQPCNLPAQVAVLRICRKHGASELTDAERADPSVCRTLGATGTADVAKATVARVTSSSASSSASSSTSSSAKTVIIEVAIGVSRADYDYIDNMLLALNESFADPNSHIKQLYKVTSNGVLNYVVEEPAHIAAATPAPPGPPQNIAMGVATPEASQRWIFILVLVLLACILLLLGAVYFFRGRHKPAVGPGETFTDRSLEREVITGCKLVRCKVEKAELIDVTMDDCSVDMTDLRGNMTLRGCATTRVNIFGSVVVEGGSLIDAVVKETGSVMNAGNRAHIANVDSSQKRTVASPRARAALGMDAGLNYGSTGNWANPSSPILLSRVRSDGFESRTSTATSYVGREVTKPD